MYGALCNLQPKMATPAEEGSVTTLSAKESNEGVVARKEMQEKGNDGAVVDASKANTEKKLFKMDTGSRSALPSDQYRGRGGSHIQGQGRGKQRQIEHGGGRVGKDKEYSQPRVRVLSRNRGGRGGSKVGRAGDDPSVAASDVDVVSRGRDRRKAFAGARGNRGGRPAGASGWLKETGEPDEGGRQNSSNSGGSPTMEEVGGNELPSAVQVKPRKNLLTDTSTGKDQDRREKLPQAALLTSEDSLCDVQKYSKAKKPVAKPPRHAQSAPVPSVQSDVLSQQLLTGTYECVVCCGRVKMEHSVWSCINCYHIFHLHCIKKWAKRPPDLEAGDQKEAWRCPVCRWAYDRVPSVYRCFCGKVTNPERHQQQLHTPHSCGRLCQRPLATDPRSLCRHTCTLPCHPGPCPQCPAMVARKCPCGRKSQQVRCGSLAEVPSCYSPCYKLMQCGRHRCLLVCHSGPCPPCDAPMTVDCHCRREKWEMTCGRWSQLGAQKEKSLSCGRPCGKTLFCGNHRCEEVCHSWACHPCPLLPENVKVCPCGRVQLSELLPPGEERTSCLDPVPTCDNTCGRTLPCSTEDITHVCEELCHHGDCPKCPKDSTIKCRCGKSSKVVACSEVEKEPEFLCDRLCNVKKSCGRHRCNARCCNDTKHICDLICGKKLQCGQHSCLELCHRGHCEKCWEYSFEELRCDCGAEVVYPPIPCGTPPPPCTRPCSRVHPCNHPVYHTCHKEDQCPPCTELIKKMCDGGHKECSVPCFLETVSCGRACGRDLPCGHKCNRSCHKGACLSEETVCQQPCSSLRKTCGHPCASTCHPGRACPNTICKEKIVVRCGCGRRSEEVLCLCSDRDDILSYAVNSEDVAALVGQLAFGESVSLTELDRVKTTKPEMRRLECDEVCHVEERNRMLAEALNIDEAKVSSFPEDPNFSDFLRQQAKGPEAVFLQQAEETIRGMIQVANKKSVPQQHAFPPAGMHKRRILHELAEAYGCDSQAFDEEPKRSVVVYTTRHSHVTGPTVKMYVQQKGATMQPRPAMLVDMATKCAREPEAATRVDYFSDDF